MQYLTLRYFKIIPWGFIEMSIGAIDASDEDVATAPNITKIGKEQEKADDDAKVSFILDIVSIVLMIIPFAGEVVDAIGGVANVARAAYVVGEAGNAALLVYDIVKKPSSAPFAILVLVMGPMPWLLARLARRLSPKLPHSAQR
ncbi:Peptidoglycan-binding Lysin subgroup [Penicillium angulare]|uniref:Peptidoglycan-binding Lysin subgroup n=1 Tax=Penicillium angulare TaxID=116970 RepID=UPI002540A7C5|nr:Peptidoglycan-binding Lysin subgroup [Penicillium angulare]KAJ5256641.1 Peptidoglycan-binding Lysin subgroup [Penicillium angulare]